MATTVYGEPLSGDPFTDRRRSGIGGSDAGAILGVSPWASPLSVFEAKRGLAPPRDAPSRRMVWGTRLEGAIIDAYADEQGRKVVRGGKRFRRHPVIPYVVGHPDGETTDGRLVEVKTTAALDEQWGEDGSDRIPAHYYAQVQHYMILRGASVCDVAVLVNGRDDHLFTVPADPDFQRELLVEEARFWERVKDDDPPDPDGSDSAGAALRRMFPMAVPEEVVATTEVAAYADAWLAAVDVEKAAAAERAKWAQLMQLYMGSRERLVGPGFKARWGNRAGSTSWKAVASKLADELLLAVVDQGADVGEDVAQLVRDRIARVIEQNRGEGTRVFTLDRVKGSEQ